MERRIESAARVVCPPRRVNSVERFGDAIGEMSFDYQKKESSCGIDTEFDAEKRGHGR